MWLVEIGSIFILTYTRLPLPSYLSWHLAHRSLYYYIYLWYSLANKPPPFILSSTSAPPVYLLLASSFLISGPASPDLSTTSLVSLYLFSWFLLDVCSKFVYLHSSQQHLILFGVQIFWFEKNWLFCSSPDGKCRDGDTLKYGEAFTLCATEAPFDTVSTLKGFGVRSIVGRAREYVFYRNSNPRPLDRRAVPRKTDHSERV